MEPLDEWHLCEKCRGRIRRNPEPAYKRFGPLTVYSACLYEGVMKECVHIFKYRKRLCLSRVLSKFMTDFIRDNGKVFEGLDLVTAVPLHPKRLRQRGFNQSEVLAQGVSRELGIPFVDALARRKDTHPQSDLKKGDRLLNVRGAFEVKNSHAVRGRAVVIIDDVLTTGSTIGECFRALKKAGARRAFALTLARGI